MEKQANNKPTQSGNANRPPRLETLGTTRFELATQAGAAFVNGALDLATDLSTECLANATSFFIDAGAKQNDSAIFFLIIEDFDDGQTELAQQWLLVGGQLDVPVAQKGGHAAGAAIEAIWDWFG